ncbi:MAG TPA: serine hydrolase, partial [Planctomycetota bacterium]|nr:serine hydrolase [Planctomycetota bacterium]
MLLARLALLLPLTLAWPARSAGQDAAAPAAPAAQVHPPVPADWPADAEWIGEPPPDPLALAADPERFAALLEQQGLGLDLATRTVRARGGTLHDGQSLEYPIEYVLVTDRGRTHEAAFVIRARPSILDACLRAVGLRPGSPLLFRLKDEPPSDEELAAGVSPWEPVPGSGPLVAITIAWTDDAGVPRQASLESLLVDARTRTALPERGWIYVGGRLGPLRQGRTVVQTHVTDLAGDVVAVYLDGGGRCLFERNSLEGLDDSLCSLNPATMPPRGTPVTILFRPTGQDVPPPPPPPSLEVVAGELGSRLDAALSAAAAQGFSGAVHVARGGQTVLEKGYGTTAVERGAPITGGTVFPLGALSRRIAAAAVLRAAAARTLDLDARLNTIVRNVPLDKVDVTPRLLLEQRSGLPAQVAEAESVDRALALRAVLDADLATLPGSACLPSEAGEALLVAALEDAAEDTWRGYLGEHVFEPARMTASDLCGEPRWEELRLARGDQGRGGLRTPALELPDWPELAARGIVSSARDLGRFERWLDGESAAFAPPCDSEEAPWRVVSGEHGRCLVASGSAPGFSAELRRWLDEDAVLVVLANVEQPQVVAELGELLLAADAGAPRP